MDQDKPKWTLALLAVAFTNDLARKSCRRIQYLVDCDDDK